MDLYVIPLKKPDRLFLFGKSFQTLFSTEMKSQGWPGRDCKETRQIFIILLILDQLCSSQMGLLLL